MRHTFQPGDELTLQKTELTTLHRGDVIVFEQSNATETISVVHRIVARRSQQWLTRGDNNLHLDPAPLSTETFIGVVVSRQRGCRTRPVVNGFSGWFYAQTLFLLKWGWFQVKRFLQPLYARLRSMHLKHPHWKPALDSLTLHTPEHGTLVKTLYRGRTVARYWVRTGAWHCRKPFDLVLTRPRPQRLTPRA